MERCCKTTIRLSPNEVESVLADEKKKWKIFRLQQVRAQSREQTCNILRAANKEEEKLKGILKQRLHKEWQGENERKQQSLETEYTDGLLKFGEAHKEAQKERETVETFKQRQVEGNRRAAERGKAAFDLLNKTKIEAEKEQTRNKSRKQTVLEKEKRRANVIAKMPTPPRFKPQLRKIPVKPKKVKFYEAGTFTTSSYLPSSVHVIREDESDDEQFRRNAREAARSENEKLELARKLNTLKEKENEKRTQERANVARKKERTRKMFSQLMDELNQAEQNHQLSDYLQECDYNFEEDVDLEQREKDAERKVEKLLEEEMEQNVGRRQMWKREVHPSDISETQGTSSSPSASPSASPSSSPSTGGIGDIYLPQLTDKFQSSKRVEIDSSDSSSIHVSFTATQKEGKEGDQVDFLAGTRGRPTIDAEDIHFKETVPVHVLPTVKHKFFEDVWMPREDPPSTEISSSSVAIESPTPESSFDEIKVRVKFQPAPDAVTPTSSEGTLFSRVSSSSVSTEYLEYPDTLRKKLEQHERQRAIRATSTLLPAPLPAFPPPAELSSGNSTSSTSYKALPDTPPEDAADIWDNMKQIQETRLKIKKIIEELKPSSETPPEKDFQTFKTPPRIYTESLKTDSSGERPKSKRQKFEEQKRRVLKHYIQRLMRMKQEELKQMSVSTVRSSGIDLSSDVSLGKLIGGQLELAFPTLSPIGVPTSQQASSDDLDTIPTKLSSSSSSSRPSDTSRVTIPAELVSNSSSVTTDTEMHCQKREVLQRMIQLQKLKKKLIVQQQRALGRDVQKIEQIQSSPQTTTSNGDSSVSASLNAESSVEWSSADTYQTPSREDSTLSRGKYSPASPTEREQSPVMQQIGQQVSAGYQDDNELPLLSTFRSNKDVSAGSSNSTPLPEGRQTQKDSSSSVASLPDMTEVLKNFGLTWAVSMIKKMDIAEEGRSSVTS